MWSLLQRVKGTVSGKEKRIYLHKLKEVRVVRKQTVGAEGKHWVRAFWGVSIGKARQEQGRQLRNG